MSLPSSTCSCNLHAPRRQETNTTYTSQPVKTYHTVDDAVYFEDDDVEAEEYTIAGSSPSYDSFNEEDDTAIAFEREDTEAAVSTLQLQVRALRKYKSNYELLCGQLGELNAQIDLQLQRHESDVTALQASIIDLQAEKVTLENQILEVQQALTVQREAADQDREYSDHVHHQLSTVAELLKATEKRLEQQEENFTEVVERLKTQIGAREEEYAETVKRLEEELEALRARGATDKEKETLRRQQENRNHKKELMTYRAKLRVVSDELEAQRSALRSTKKHLTQVQTDNEALHKQLANVKRDRAHLSNIIDSQRVENESNADELKQFKKAKTQLVQHVALVDQEAEQLQNELAEAKEELVFKNNQLDDCRDEMKKLRISLQEAQQEQNTVQCVNEKLMKKIAVFQTTESEQCIKKQRGIQERKYRKEIIRMHELLADNQQRTTESSKGVQKLRRELLGVQKLLHGCTGDITPGPIDQWKASQLKNPSSLTLMEQVRAFST
ncbi:hypothetical protein P3T76_010084 [Phytophthora citrophthora]|uniref:Uncharacterized protein n=1 Tax=Phytophthora citrophthora TaxID=4793 RepID=A0AAD9GDY3_9STRA|nr:hypothetical protein P3T76_010084 [Phytophthora citrophthora]